MCHDTDASPPLPPVSGGAGSGKLITLKSADGTEFAAFAATSDQPNAAGMVVIPDVRGLHGFYQELALRFAEAGVHSVAIDFFGRTAGVGTRDDGFPFMEHIMQTRPKQIAEDVRAAVDYMKTPEGGAAKSIFTVGFCFGGRASFNQAAEGHGLAGVVGFYGPPTPRNENDTQAPIDQLKDYKAPVLGLFGGADQGIPRERVEEFRQGLESAGIENDIVIYDGAPHSFFDRAFDQFKSACDDAWMRILEFVSEHK